MGNSKLEIAALDRAIVKYEKGHFLRQAVAVCHLLVRATPGSESARTRLARLQSAATSHRGVEGIAAARELARRSGEYPAVAAPPASRNFEPIELPVEGQDRPPAVLHEAVDPRSSTRGAETPRQRLARGTGPQAPHDETWPRLAQGTQPPGPPAIRLPDELCGGIMLRPSDLPEPVPTAGDGPRRRLPEDIEAAVLAYLADN
jgi:hypothetical protein